jgi:chemotaxis regulatin CheY-phosphate phosphatase CheZ
MAENPTNEISLELSEGQFRVLANGIALNILVKPNGFHPAPSAGSSDRKSHPEPTLPDLSGTQESLEYYRGISQDMYHEIGRLAKDLNVSLQNLSLDEIIQADIGSPGERLDQAQMQLSDVIKMTEKATLTILDSIEQIREDCKEVEDTIDKLAQPAVMQPGDSGDGSSSPLELEQLMSFCRSARTLLPELVSEGEAIQVSLQAIDTGQDEKIAMPEDLPAPENLVPVYHFAIDTILQTVYEFCTNETVKKHLKTIVLSRSGLFNEAPINDSLNQLAQTMQPDDNFFNFSVDGVLKILSESCQDEQARGLLNKMAATAGKIFLDLVLPLEVPPATLQSTPTPQDDKKKGAVELGDGILGQDDIDSLLNFDAVSDSPSSDAVERGQSGHLEEVRSQISVHLSRLRDLSVQVQDLSLQPEKILAQRQNISVVPGESDQITQSVKHTHERMSRITETLSRVIEALSFQDLAGQRLLKVSKTLRQLQIQLLSLVVAFGTKIKKKDEGKEPKKAESEAMALHEIDRLLTASTPAESAEPGQSTLGNFDQALDQSAVNDLLASLGF